MDATPSENVYKPYRVMDATLSENVYKTYGK